MGNIFLIRPRKLGSVWVFDDETRNVKNEPFVGATNLAIDNLVKNIEGAESGFNLLFSDNPFPAAEQFELVEWDNMGATYLYKGIYAWLCPCVFKYFPKPPQRIYAKGEK